MSARKIVIEFLGDSKSLQNAMGDAESKGGRLSGTLGKVGKAAAIGLGAGVVIAAKGLYDMTKGAIEDEAAQAKLAQQLKNSAGATDKQVASVEDWITAQGKALGVTDDDLRPALSKLVTATKDVAEAQDLASLAMDASAGTGKSLESVSNALMKARNGEVGSLSKLGIATKNAAGETMSFEEITRSMADTFEGQAATKANTLEGKMARLKLVLSETGETIGSKLIPMVTNVADWFLTKGLPAAQAFGGWLQDTLGPIFQRVRDVVSGVMAGVDGDVSGGLGRVQAIFQSVTSIITSLWDTFGSTILDFAAKTFANVQTVIGGALQIVQGIFQTFSALLKGDWSGAWDGVKTILAGAWEVIKGVVRQALNVVGTLLEAGWSAAKGIVSAAWDGIKTLVSAGIGKVVDFVQGIPGKFSNALSSLKSTAAGLFDDAMTAGKEKVTNIGATIVGWIAEIPGKLRDKIGDFKSAGGALIGAVVDGMKNAGGVIEGIASNVWTAIKGLLNSAIDKINAALSFTINLPGPDLHVDVGNIGHLARGTSNWRGGLAVVGEEGPELVNLPRGSRVTPHDKSMGALRGLAGGGSMAPTIVQLVVGGRVLEQILIQHTRETGEPLQVRTLGPSS